MSTCSPQRGPDAMALLDRRDFLTFAGGAAIAASSGAAWAKAGEEAVVTTRLGLVRGRAEGGIRIFTGIPYGSAERFAPPRPAPRWHDILDATRPAAVAPQPPGPMPRAGRMSEDCLQLNIWAPSGPGPYPVYFYIHGGGNETGWSGDAGHAGDRFAAHDVICVTANYRVGALGYLELGEMLGPRWAGSGNNGMRDILLALRWVRGNIAAFGGDPARITIAGESAGGKNVAALMGMPAADGLYARAAIYSGGGETVLSTEEARGVARLYVEKLGGAARLHTAPVEALLAAQAAAKAAWPRNYPFRPMVDGATLPQVPLDRIFARRAPPVALLIGSNADESRLFLTPEQAAGPLLPAYVANESMTRMAALDAAYARAFPALSVAERHWRLMTAEEYGMPCLRLADAHAARGAPVYRYRLTYPAPGGAFAGHSPHVLDVPFTFDHAALPGFAALFGLSAADQPFADQVHQAVVRFIAGEAPAAPGLPAWRRYDVDHRETMVLSHNSALESDPDRAERLIWAGTSARTAADAPTVRSFA